MTATDFANAYDMSLPGPAFSNGTEGESWMAAWCAKCAHSTDGADGCVLTDVAMIGRIPADWVEVDPASRYDRYICQRWSPAAGYVDLREVGRPR
jgi:hypothetical protein